MWPKAFIVLLCMALGGCVPTGRTKFDDVPVKLTTESNVCVGDGCADERHAVVFVHGLTGSSLTWKNGNFDWPSEFVNDPLLSNYDVYQIEYESNRIRNSANLTEINSEFTTIMRGVSKKGYKSIAFVAHSLGGNITRRYLLTVKSFAGHYALNKFRVIILLGTPLGGSQLANIFKNISQNPQVETLIQIDENDFLQLLNEQIHGTVQKHEDSGCPSLRFYSAYEKKGTPPIGIIVPKASATLGAYACEGFELTHSFLAKPESSESAVYKEVRALLSACAAEHDDVCPKPEQRSNLTCGQREENYDENALVPLRCSRGW